MHNMHIYSKSISSCNKLKVFWNPNLTGCRCWYSWGAQAAQNPKCNSMQFWPCVKFKGVCCPFFRRCATIGFLDRQCFDLQHIIIFAPAGIGWAMADVCEVLAVARIDPATYGVLSQVRGDGHLDASDLGGATKQRAVRPATSQSSCFLFSFFLIYLVMALMICPSIIRVWGCEEDVCSRGL